MKTALLRALAAHDSRISDEGAFVETPDGPPYASGESDPPACACGEHIAGRCPDDAPDSRRGMCGTDCGGLPCSRDKGHDAPCSPDGDPPTDIRAIVRAELARRGDGALVMLAAALRGRWGKSQKSRVEQLSRWLNGSRTDARASIPLYAFEAVLDVLGLEVVRQAPG